MDCRTLEGIDGADEEVILSTSLLNRSKEECQRLLERTRLFTSEIERTYQQLGQIERQLQQLLAGGPSNSLQLYTRPKQRLSPFEILLIIYHPVLDNLAEHLDCRDLMKLGRVSQGLRKVIYNNRSAWKHLNFGTYSYPRTHHGLSTELLIRITRKIPLDNLRSLVLDRTDVNVGAVTAIMAEARKTLIFVSVQGCRKIALKGLLYYFCQESKYRYSQLTLKKFHMHGVPGIMAEDDEDFIEARSPLGKIFNAMIKHLAKLKIETDVGPCIGGFKNCQGIRYRYERADVDDRVMGEMLMEQCWKCGIEPKHFYCQDCIEDRECFLCERHICEDCEASRPDGIAKSNTCTACQYPICDQCYEFDIYKFKDCRCVYCPCCMSNHDDDVPTLVGQRELFLKSDKERIRVTKTMCDHCGVDKCKDCWRKGSVQLRSCIECARTVCENCGIGVACDECNACICDSCVPPSGEKSVPQRKNWLCDYCSWSFEPPQAEQCVEVADKDNERNKGKGKETSGGSVSKLRVVDIRSYWKQEKSDEFSFSPPPMDGSESQITRFFGNRDIGTKGPKHDLEEIGQGEGRTDKRIRLEIPGNSGGDGPSAGSSLL